MCAAAITFFNADELGRSQKQKREDVIQPSTMCPFKLFQMTRNRANPPVGALLMTGVTENWTTDYRLLGFATPPATPGPGSLLINQTPLRGCLANYTHLNLTLRQICIIIPANEHRRKKSEKFVPKRARRLVRETFRVIIKFMLYTIIKCICCVFSVFLAHSFRGDVPREGNFSP